MTSFTNPKYLSELGLQKFYNNGQYLLSHRFIYSTVQKLNHYHVNKYGNVLLPNKVTIILLVSLYIYIYIYIYWRTVVEGKSKPPFLNRPIGMMCPPIIGENGVQSHVESYQKLKKWYLMPPYIILRIIREGSRLIGATSGKGVAPSP